MRSYSLIELIMVLVVVSIIAAIATPMILAVADAWSFGSRFQDNAVSSAIIASNRMSREIRRLRNDASITTATVSQLTFTDMDNNSITYNLSGNTLMRNTDGLIDNVNNLTFIYYDDDGNPILTPVVSPNNTDIRRIGVDFSILAASNTLNFRFQTRPQNLRRLNEKFK